MFMILKKMSYFLCFTTLCMDTKTEINKTFHIDISEEVKNNCWCIFNKIKHWKFDTENSNKSLEDFFKLEDINAQNLKENMDKFIEIYNEIIEVLNIQSCEVNPQEYYNDYNDSSNSEDDTPNSTPLILDNYAKYPEISYEILEEYQNNTEIKTTIDESIDVINKIIKITKHFVHKEYEEEFSFDEYSTKQVIQITGKFLMQCKWIITPMKDIFSKQYAKHCGYLRTYIKRV